MSRTPKENGAWAANLPTCFRKPRNQHAEDRATGSRHVRTIHRAWEILFTTRATRKLNGESLSFEITPI